MTEIQTEAIWASFKGFDDLRQEVSEIPKREKQNYIQTLKLIYGDKPVQKITATKALELTKILLKNVAGKANATAESLAGNWHAINVFIGVATMAKHARVRLFALRLLATEMAERVTTCLTQAIISDSSPRVVSRARQLLAGREITGKTGVALGFERP